MSLYPYQRIRLACGCHEIVTGPGATSCFVCQEHEHFCDRDGTGGPLEEAVIDCFTHASRSMVTAERERCAKIADAQAAACEAKGNLAMTVYGAAECRAVAATIRKEPPSRSGVLRPV